MKNSGSPLRVVVVAHDRLWPPCGGGSIRIHWVIRLLAAKGHRVTVVAPLLHQEGLAEAFPNVRFFQTGRFSRFVRFKEFVYFIHMIRTFFRLLSIPADVFYAQSAVVGIPTVLAGRLRDIPVVFDMIDLITGLSKNPWVSKYGQFLEKWVLRYVDFSIVTAANLVTFAKNAGAKHVELVRHGVDLTRFYPRPVKKKPWIMYMGGIEVFDGVFLIPEAAFLLNNEFPNLRFLFVGEGKMLSVLQERVETLGLSSRFEFRGWVPQTEIPNILSQSLLGLITNLHSPGMMYAAPLRLVEYMAMGLPFVAPDLPGIEEQVRLSQAGLLFKTGDSKSLADAIQTLLKNPSLRERLGKNGRAYALRHANWHQNAGRIVEICEAVARGKHEKETPTNFCGYSLI